MLDEIARQAVADTADFSEACRIVRERVAALAENERAEIADELLKAASMVAVSRARHSIRVGFRAVADDPAGRMRILSAAAGGVAAQTILESWIVGNTRLGDCDAGSLGAAANAE